MELPTVSSFLDNKQPITSDENIYFKDKKSLLNDYFIAQLSREISLLSRREVLTGKAKFGILGDGKELPQIALSKVFRRGDFRSGYYRDQTIMLALGLSEPSHLFAQLYANPNPEEEPHSAGRQMNCHFATHSLDENGDWKNLMEQYNSSADIAPTAGQMSRAVGLALASKTYRSIPALHSMSQFSNKGNEVVFVTIGDSSTSEGPFWESINAVGVMQVPMLISVWDDGYGISVPKKYQTTKESISEVLSGFQRTEDKAGFDIYTVKAWDYPNLCKVYQEAAEKVRRTHIPAIVHVMEVTQQQGHSTSGSHERYKTKERLSWEKEWDCNKKMKEWILQNGLATKEELLQKEREAKTEARAGLRKAWSDFNEPLKKHIANLINLYDRLHPNVHNKKAVMDARESLLAEIHPTLRDIAQSARNLLMELYQEQHPLINELRNWKNQFQAANQETYSSYLFSQTEESALNVREVKPAYGDVLQLISGYEILNQCFDAAFARDERVMAFGEDVGHIGGVNQAFAGLQEKYGIERIFDTGIRENTIMGQGIGLAMRGLRPIAEIQYLDYFIYGMQPIVDDLSTIAYRTKGRQKAPMIIRTRGHRLEGVWHTGSPMGMILNGIRGVHVLVPRNMTQAAGFYNTLLQSDEPALVVECLNGYRLKEKKPENIADMQTPLGKVEVLQAGKDITLVTYGSTCRIVEKAAERLKERLKISCEVIDVQSLLPFDLEHDILKSLQKTNRLLIVDEDVPGGASAFILQQIIEVQGGFKWLDSAPATLTAKAHRAAYGSDGDYYSKPNIEDVVEKVYGIMHEVLPKQYPLFF
ncbi:MAG: thiamine pyrophosphate-dependent enzyme [Chitinophagales bacterium]